MHGGPVAAVEGTSFTQVVATFTDTNPFSSASDFSATINWGDGGSDPGTIQQQGSGPNGVTYVVMGTHTYNDDDTGAEAETNQIVTTITDKGGSIGVVSSLAEVSDPVLTDPGINITAVVGTPFCGRGGHVQRLHAEPAAQRFSRDDRLGRWLGLARPRRGRRREPGTSWCLAPTPTRNRDRCRSSCRSRILRVSQLPTRASPP